ncbi:MAG: glycosyltransferase [Bacteroidales bacterium]|nr:glycosyltransferase [Bacteroidales bacterium]
MTRVLFLIESLSGGGAEKVLVSILRNLDKDKFEVTLCVVSSIGPYVDEVHPTTKFIGMLPDPSRLHGFRSLCYKIKYKLIHEWLSPKWVYRSFFPKGFDVEVAFTEGFATKLMASSTNRASKKIAWVHTDLASNPWPVNRGVFKDSREEGDAFRAFDMIVGVSDAVCDSLRSIYGIDAATVCNPVDSEEIIRLSEEHVPLPPKETFRMISIGRLVPQKAFDRLLNVASRLKGEGIAFQLWILGEGPCRGQLERLIREKGLMDLVTLWGFKNNPFPYLSVSDLFVCSSVAEGMSTAVTEAMVLGLPIVTTDCAGMRELFGGKACGIIAENDEDSLYEAIMECYSDPCKLQGYASEAVARAKEFSLEKSMAVIEEVLSK